MLSPTYQTVAKLAEQLDTDEQRSLINHLQETIRRRELTNDEWFKLLDSITFSSPPGPLYSDRREDWYDDDGR